MSSEFLPLQIAGGSLSGRDHLLAGKNNQDAFTWRRGANALAAVVTDGCSAGAHSEVGARLGAEWLVELLVATPGDFRGAQHALLERLEGLVVGTGKDRARFIESHLLFTLVGMLVTEGTLTTFSLGDGLISLNGARRVLGPFPGNAPPYLAYRLLGMQGEALSLQIDPPFPLTDVRTVVIGTDGAVDVPSLDQLVDDGRLFNNPDMVRRRLAVLRREGATLPDDTTLVVLRNRPPFGEV